MNFAGSIRLFRILGITVYLHWSWLLIALIEIKLQSRYGSMLWSAAEYLLLFGIVLTHEFGHALACRSVGGVAERIVLWPLGGVAFVNPPRRPGAVLWSIAAGPLVNVILVPVTIMFALAAGVDFHHLQQGSPLRHLALSLVIINASLLFFNMLPIYPLDGGQIFQSILWFFLGLARSLRLAAGVGLVMAVALGLYFVMLGEWWLVVMAIFLGSQAYRGWRVARILAAQEQGLVP